MNQLVMPSKAVLSFPYEGGIYFLLNQHLNWASEAAQRDSGYYSVLFGRNAQFIKSQATAIGSIFSEIILVGADSSLPDRESSTVDGDYWHPDFRIRIPNSHYAEWEGGNKEKAKELLGSRRVVESFRRNYPDKIHENDRLQILCRLLLQMNAAQTFNAVIVGDERLCELHKSVLTELTINNPDQEKSKASDTLALSDRTLNFIGLEFNCPDLDAFAAVRQSRSIQGYADQFRLAISTARNAPDLTEKLMNLMREAKDTHEISKSIAGGFETGSSIIGIAGMIPFVGSVTGAIGLGTDAAARAARRIQEKRDWYAIGSHMQRIALDDLLARGGRKSELSK